jgi:hypothetical protein
MNGPFSIVEKEVMLGSPHDPRYVHCAISIARLQIVDSSPSTHAKVSTDTIVQ